MADSSSTGSDFWDRSIRPDFKKAAGKGDPPTSPPSSPPGGARGEPLVPTSPHPSGESPVTPRRPPVTPRKPLGPTFSGRGIAATGTEDNDSTYDSTGNKSGSSEHKIGGPDLHARR
jgi:hypothetical protein